MNKIWYLSPSCQEANIGVGNYGSEKKQMNLLVEQIVPHLDRAGISFHVADADMTIAERTAESNQMGVCFHLALHSNAGGQGLARGPVAYYYSDQGKAVGEKLVRNLLRLGQENNRAENVKQNTILWELKRTKAPACLLEVDFHDSPDGVIFLTTRREEIAEAIARAIIEADGKEFVPVTLGEELEKAVSMGLFPRETRWNSLLTKADAALLAVRLMHLLKKEVNL